MYEMMRAAAAAVLAVAMPAMAEAQLTEIASVPLNQTYNGSEIAVAEGFAYVGDASDLVVVDVRSPAAPTIVARVAEIGVADVLVLGRHLYVTSGVYLSVFDIATPATPVKIGSVRIDGARRMTAGAGYLYLLTEQAGATPPALKVVSLANPASPVAVGSLTLPVVPERVAFAGTHAYVADRAGGLRIIDVSVPSVPRAVTSLALGNVYGVALSGGYAYVTEHEFSCDYYCGPYAGKVHVVDISLPECPRVIASLQRQFAPESVVVDGRQLYVVELPIELGAWASRTSVIDITNPVAPAEVAYRTAAAEIEVAVSGGYLFTPEYRRMSISQAWAAPNVCPAP